MNYLIAAVLLCCAIAPSFAGFVRTNSCSDNDQQGTLISVDILGCNENECNVERGKNITLTATFIPHVNVTKSTAKAFATQLGFKVPYILPNKNACKNMDCPLKAGVPAVYTASVPVYYYVFKKPAIVEGILLFDGKSGICYTFNANVVK